MVPVEEPVASEYVQNIKDGGVVDFQLQGDGRDGLSHRGKEGAHGLSVRWGESRGGDIA